MVTPHAKKGWGRCVCGLENAAPCLSPPRSTSVSVSTAQAPPRDTQVHAVVTYHLLAYLQAQAGLPRALQASGGRPLLGSDGPRPLAAVLRRPGSLLHRLSHPRADQVRQRRHRARLLQTLPLLLPRRQGEGLRQKPKLGARQPLTTNHGPWLTRPSPSPTRILTGSSTRWSPEFCRFCLGRRVREQRRAADGRPPHCAFSPWFSVPSFVLPQLAAHPVVLVYTFSELSAYAPGGTLKP